MTVYEALEDAGLVTAAVNITCYRGRTRHLPTLPWVTKPAYGPKRFFFYSLFESDPTGAPLAVRNRAAGSIDAYAAAVGRWLVTRDGFDFLAYYLSDFDYASHAHGPDGADGVALERTDAAIQALLDAAGGVGRVPRALRGRAPFRPRPDGCRAGRAARDAARRRSPARSSSPRRTAPARSTSCPGARVDAAQLARAARRRGVRRGDAAARGRRRGRAPRRRGAALPAVRRPAGRRAATRRSSTIRTRCTAAGRRSRIRTPASCSSPRPRAGSSSTSAAATTRAAAATARSSRATRSCRC